jgi:drug/metabolite transporter (DMT)-like permease
MARNRIVMVAAIIAIAGGIVLVVLDDAHGVAILLGAAIGAAHGVADRAIRRRQEGAALVQ